MFKSMKMSFVMLSLLASSFLNHASPAITVTYANGTLSFPHNGTGSANYVVHVDKDVTPKNATLSFTAALPLWATQITSGANACAGVPICAKPFPLSAGQSCCLMLSLDGSKLDEGNALLQPQVKTTPTNYNSYAAPETITVSSSQYTVGGAITGLTGTVTLLNNGLNALTTSTDGKFTFTTALTDGNAYAVTVQTQPTNQTCTVNNASGTIHGANVTNVTVTCATNTYTVGGTLSGLDTAHLESVVLQNNGGDDLTRNTNGSFTFPTTVAEGATYQVTVLTQPATQTCTVSNGIGTMGGSNVTNVTVTCATNTYTVGGTLSGLDTADSESVVLQNNGGDNLMRNANGSFIFPIMVAEGATYQVTVLTQPATQTCTVSNGTGTMGGSNVTNVGVSCVSNNNTTLMVPATGTIPVTSGGTTTNTVTVTNTGSVAATNVHAVLPGGWTAVTQTPCTTIAPNNGTCTLVFSSSKPYVAQENITITGDNITSPPVIALAFSMSEYLVFDVPTSSTAIVVASSDASGSPQIWDTSYNCTTFSNCTQTNASSIYNGSYLDSLGDTYLIISGANAIGTQNLTGGNAASVCYNITSDNSGTGLTNGTWFLPAICQLGNNVSGGMDAGCGSNVANIETNLFYFGFLPDLKNQMYYWSSSEYSADNVWYQYFAGVGDSFQAYDIKLGQLGVRCVRAFTY